MGFLGSLFGSKSNKGKGAEAGSPAVKEHEQKAAGTAMKATDPVCGMEVDPKTAAGKSDYMGQTYYFCAPGCKKTFDADPAKYASGGGQQTAEHSGHKM